MPMRRHQRRLSSEDRALAARQYAPTLHTRAVPSATVRRPHHACQDLRRPRWRGAGKPQALHGQRLRQQHTDKTGNTQDRLDRQWPQRHSLTGRHNINNSEDQHARLRGV